LNYPVRKSPRMKCFDYSTPTSYFITICTHEKTCLFGLSGAHSPYGLIAKETIQQIPQHFPGIQIDHAVVMPNHVHLLLTVHYDAVPNGQPFPNVSDIIGKYKAAVSRKIHKCDSGAAVWQRSFHDHVIRNERSWQEIWQYIEENPLKWEQDCFYQG